MEGTTDPEPIEHSVLAGSLDSRLMEGMSSLEPLGQSVLNTLLVARPLEGIAKTDPAIDAVLMAVRLGAWIRWTWSQCAGLCHVSSRCGS